MLQKVKAKWWKREMVRVEGWITAGLQYSHASLRISDHCLPYCVQDPDFDVSSATGSQPGASAPQPPLPDAGVAPVTKGRHTLLLQSSHTFLTVLSLHLAAAEPWSTANNEPEPPSAAQPQAQAAGGGGGGWGAKLRAAVQQGGGTERVLFYQHAALIVLCVPIPPCSSHLSVQQLLRATCLLLMSVHVYGCLLEAS